LVHQRLYIPYTFGTLYNHPIEGFLLNSLGALLSKSIVGLLVRLAMLFLLLSTCQTVDDYCGYSLPFDRLQMFSSNTANYHDIHHQVIDLISTTKSELTHHIMLVNLLRLLGAIKTKKASR
jgi:sphinganine C4-monooxygenase